MQIKATVLKLSLFSALVMTEDCEFKKISRKAHMEIGSEIFIKLGNKAEPFPNWKAVALLASLMIVLAMTVYRGIFLKDNLVFATIDIDIEPSVSFSIDKDYRVVSVSSLNNHGKEVLKQVDLRKKDVADAVVLLTKTANDMNYKSDFVLVSGSINGSYKERDGEMKLDGVLDSIVKSKEKHNPETRSQTIKVSSEMGAEAKKNKISLARQAALSYVDEEDKLLSLDKIKNTESSSIFRILASKDRAEKDPSKPELVATDKKPEVQVPIDKKDSKDKPPEQKIEQGSKDKKVTDPKPKEENSKDDSKEDSVKDLEKDKLDDKNSIANQELILNIKLQTKGAGLSWNQLLGSQDSFSYYMLTISRINTESEHRENQYYIYKSDIKTTHMTINPGDIFWTYGEKKDDFITIKPGESYHISVTGVYEDGKEIASKPVKITLPKEEKEEDKEQPSEEKAK